MALLRRIGYYWLIGAVRPWPAMEVDGSGSGVAQGVAGTAPAAASQISLHLLQTIRTAQSQNGLKHGDYGRYRYASRIGMPNRCSAVALGRLHTMPFPTGYTVQGA